MAYSDLNYTSPKQLKAVFGLSDGKFTALAIEGKFRFKRKYQKPLIHMDSVASIYEDRENVVLKKWGYDYESPKEKYQKMLDTHLKGFPRCFFKVKDVEDGYYRVFYKGTDWKLCVFIIEGMCRIICFSRDRENEMEQLYLAFEDGKVDIEG